MKTRGLAPLTGVLVLAMVILTGYSPVARAQPTGEVTTVTAILGNETLILHYETSHSNDFMQLMYDHLIGAERDGKLFADNGIAHKWE
jgi:hypothetical protein